MREKIGNKSPKKMRQFGCVSECGKWRMPKVERKMTDMIRTKSESTGPKEDKMNEIIWNDWIEMKWNELHRFSGHTLDESESKRQMMIGSGGGSGDNNSPPDETVVNVVKWCESVGPSESVLSVWLIIWIEAIYFKYFKIMDFFLHFFSLYHFECSRSWKSASAPVSRHQPNSAIQSLAKYSAFNSFRTFRWFIECRGN